jgi:hypothetical protein
MELRTYTMADENALQRHVSGFWPRRRVLYGRRLMYAFVPVSSA